MNLLEVIKQQVPDFSRVDVNPIFNDSKLVIGWTCVSYLMDGFPFSGGTHENKETAIRICVAEALERALFFKLSKSYLKDEYLISEFPSTCGFACGFENDKTALRALCEGLERWAWSKWIDSGHKIEIASDVNLDILSNELIKVFQKWTFYKKDFFINNTYLQFCVFVGETEFGAFAGSRVCGLQEDPWQHAIVEAFRNHRNFELFEKNKTSETKEDIVRLRAIYFGSNKASASRQILAAIEGSWPTPSIRLFKQINTKIPNVYLWRCILYDWISWDIGDESRFVY